MLSQDDRSPVLFFRSRRGALLLDSYSERIPSVLLEYVSGGRDWVRVDEVHDQRDVILVGCIDIRGLRIDADRETAWRLWVAATKCTHHPRLMAVVPDEPDPWPGSPEQLTLMA